MDDFPAFPSNMRDSSFVAALQKVHRSHGALPHEWRDGLSWSVPAPVTGLEVEVDLGGDGPRRHVVRAAEGREEVIERVSVGEIDGRNLRAQLVTFRPM